MGAISSGTVLVAERSVLNYWDVHSSGGSCTMSEEVTVLKWFLISVWKREAWRPAAAEGS